MSNPCFKLSYIPELDGLRGFAILAVIFFHANASFLNGGFIGVDIFFVLSGFLITSLLVQEFDHKGSVSLKHFYVRRMLRLGPALLLLLVIFCAVSFIFLNEEKAVANLIDALIALVYLSNWARAFDIHPPDFLGHTWSLSIEEQFYILWPIILLGLLRIIKNRWYVFLFSITIALFSWFLRVVLTLHEASVERLYNGLDTRADGLMIGCALGILLSSGLVSEKFKMVFSRWLEYIAPVFMIFLFAFLMVSDWLDPKMYYFGFLVIEVLVAGLILDIVINKKSMVSKILAMRWLVWVGSISYGLYLWHYPIFRTMFALGYNFWAVIVFGTLITFVIATCSYYLLEKPILKFRRSFELTRFKTKYQPAPVLTSSS